VTVVGGWVPRQSSGWMWDLTVPGNNDHDFYVQAALTPILVHNICGPGTTIYREFPKVIRVTRKR
jgi:hypothetical protein